MRKDGKKIKDTNAPWFFSHPSFDLELHIAVVVEWRLGTLPIPSVPLTCKGSFWSFFIPGRTTSRSGIKKIHAGFTDFLTTAAAVYCYISERPGLRKL